MGDAALEDPDLAEEVVVACAGAHHAGLGDDAEGGVVPGEGDGSDRADTGLGEGPVDGGAGGLGGVAEALRVGLDAVAYLGHAVVGEAVEDDAADDAAGAFAADHEAVAPEAQLGVVADGLDVGGEGALDERAARPGLGQRGAHERLGPAAVAGEDRLDHRQGDRDELEPPGGD